MDLDATSYGWCWRKTPSIGDPRNAYGAYDLEDVVFPNVRYDLEVRSGDSAAGGEPYDEMPNVALRGGSPSITTWNVGTTHTEVHRPEGTTMPRVARWVLEHL